MSVEKITKHLPKGQSLPALFDKLLKADPPFEIEWNNLKDYGLKSTATKEVVPFARQGEGSLLALWYHSKTPAVVLIGGHGDWGVVATSFEDFLKAINCNQAALIDCDDNDEFKIRGVKGKPVTKGLTELTNKFASWLNKFRLSPEHWVDLAVDQGDLSKRLNDPKPLKKLQAAIEAKDYSAVRKMLDASPGIVNTRLPSGSALETASSTHDLEMIKLLVEKGANPNLRALRYGIMYNVVGDNDLEIVRYLVDHAKADVRAEMGDGLSVLFNVRSTAMAEYLLGQGVDPKKLDKNSGSALHVAACWGLTDVVKLYLAAEVDATIENQFGDTAISKAVGSGSDPTAILELLLNHGGKLDLIDEEGNTLLHNAGSVAAAKWLLKHGANREAKNNEGDTPQKHASKYIYDENRQEVAKFLAK